VNVKKVLETGGHTPYNESIKNYYGEKGVLALFRSNIRRKKL